MLPSMIGGAAGRSYRRSPALLQAAVAGAANGGRQCCHSKAAVLTTCAAVLPVVVTGATDVAPRCCKRWSPELPMEDGGVAIGRWWC